VPPLPPALPPLPDFEAADIERLEAPDVLRDEVEALFAADRVRLAPPDFEAPALFFAVDFVAFAADFFAPPRADERAAAFVDEPFEAELLLFVAALFAPDFEAPFAADFLAPVFAALFLAPDFAALAFLVLLEPDLRDLVVLSAILASFQAFA
jgi:hypothetical protein